MARRSLADIEKIWTNVDGLKRVSDRVIGIGPFGLGLDALLTWIPVVGTVYSVGAGGWLLIQAMRAKAEAGTILRMIGYLAVDVTTGEVPIVGDAVDALFPGHLMAANALQKHIESTHWVEDSYAAAQASGAHEAHVQKVRGDRALKRIIYLHD
jgi:hypothetical protein